MAPVVNPEPDEGDGASRDASGDRHDGFDDVPGDCERGEEQTLALQVLAVSAAGLSTGQGYPPRVG